MLSANGADSYSVRQLTGQRASAEGAIHPQTCGEVTHAATPAIMLGEDTAATERHTRSLEFRQAVGTTASTIDQPKPPNVLPMS